MPLSVHHNIVLCCLLILNGLLSHCSGCDSVILYSPGRTATDTVSETVIDSTSLSYCRMKEYYGHGLKPTFSNLKSCYESKISKGGAYVHVKPEHITFKGSQETKAPSSHLVNPEQFFNAAKKIGFSTVITSFRDNQLARSVSSYEMKKRSEEEARRSWIDIDLKEHFKSQVLLFNRGVIAAKQNNFTMLAITFNEIVADLCGTANKVSQFAKCSKFQCKVGIGHTDKSHHDRTLAGRIGAEAAASVLKQLTNTPYEWMLDLEASEWPKSIPRPVQLLNGPYHNRNKF
jgi:hypothetical protein